jgi:monoamine oxidase
LAILIEVRMNSMIRSVTRRQFLYRAAAVGGSALLLNTMNAWGMGIGSKVNAPPALTGSGTG